MTSKKEKIRLLKIQNDNTESERKFLMLKNKELERQIEAYREKDFVNFDGVMIRKKDIIRIAFLDTDLEEGILKPVAKIDYYFGGGIETEALMFENVDTFKEFYEEIKNVLSIYNYSFGEQKRVLFQKDLSIAPDENGEPKVQSVIVGKEYI